MAYYSRKLYQRMTGLFLMNPTEESARSIFTVFVIHFQKIH